MLQPFGAGMRGWGCSVFPAHLLDESESVLRDHSVLGREGGVAWDSPRGEGAVCPWAERGGDSGRRGGHRMRALRVSQALVRSFSSTARNRFENRVAEKQKLFQVGGARVGRGRSLGRPLGPEKLGEAGA